MEWLNSIWETWDWGVFLPEVLGKATGVVVGILLSWFLVIRRRLQSLGRLSRGDTDDVLFQAHYLHPIENEKVQLLFRNVAEKRTIEQIYDNPAAAKLIKTLGDQTELNQPILPTHGTIGFEVLNDAAGWISGSLATSPMPRRCWLFCLTAEDRKVVRKRCVRGFLIKPDDLIRFHDWEWCRETVTVERPWHWFRVVALHRIARQYADQCRAFAGGGVSEAMPLVDDQAGHRRIVTLSLGLIELEQPIAEPFEVTWSERLDDIEAKGLCLEKGSLNP